MFRKPSRKANIRRMKKIGCSFCTDKKAPDYKDAIKLKSFLSERGKILGRDKTGVCPKHQRILAIAIKRARHLALLPFVNRV